MISTIFRKIFGSRNERVLKRMRNEVVRINALEDEIAKLKDDDFPKKTQELKDKFAAGETLETLLPLAFALVREAAKRTLDMRHFDVQLIGGMVLNEGNIAEMRTGEGKTLVATLPAYLNAITGKGVHIITVNDYLAKRDAEWMGKVYTFLGLSTGVIVQGLNTDERREAYSCDITYGTNNEFGFDYLRDNMKFTREGRVQRELNYTIVDEVDSILIDEARTPLIISGPVDDRSDLYISINKLIPKLRQQIGEDGDEVEKEKGDFTLDEKSNQAYLTEQGHETVERLLKENKIIGEDQNLYDAVNVPVLHHLNAALRAHTLYQKDVEYIVQDNQVVIVDEFTGRTMPGRRWSEGLHQAIEAKEGVPIQNENQTLATITYQNYFRLYNKLSGMTGTADTEAFEFQQIYGLEVVVIPTHETMIRDDQPDVIYMTAKEKFSAIIEDIKECIERGQPVLVGTASIDVSELISKLLNKEQIKHQVLNAKFHEKEAEIITQAGLPGTVTIATNMAGRGTDIVLGGNVEEQIKQLEIEDQVKVEEMRQGWNKLHEQVITNGGLRIVGTERHESRRIDNQLRGRSGRQGDPGSSQFYLSLEDNLMRIFASERVSAIMQKLGMEEGEAIESGLVSKAIENAQRKVEAHNFDMRKHLLEYDDVANDQRKVIYEWRNDLLEEKDISGDLNNLRDDVGNAVISLYMPEGSTEELWDINGLSDAIEHEFGIKMDLQTMLDSDPDLHEESLKEIILEEIHKTALEKEKQIPAELMRNLEKDLMLDVLDRHWKEHLVAMDHLRQGIGLRGYAAKNPKQEYKREAFAMFGEMLENIKTDVVGIISKVNIRTDQDAQIPERKAVSQQKMTFNHPDAPGALTGGSEATPPATPQKEQPFIRKDKKIGRNEPCPCGSGKKYKQCHGKVS